MVKFRRLLLPLLAALLFLPAAVRAQTYAFSVPEERVDVYLNNDGTLDLEYTFVFLNDASADPIDVVDIGLPNDSYDITNIQAEINGRPIPIEAVTISPYVTYGVALDLGENDIQPGERGTLYFRITGIQAHYYPDSTDAQYASFQFAPTWFGSEFAHGQTDLTLAIHLPPGVGPNEPRWHAPPDDFPARPQTALDAEGRPTYTWKNPAANAYTRYIFGISVPQQYVVSAILLNAERIDLTVRQDGSVQVRYALEFTNQSSQSDFSTLSLAYDTYLYSLTDVYSTPELLDVRAALNGQPLPPPQAAYGTLDIRLGERSLKPGESGLLEVAYTMPPAAMLTADWYHDKYQTAILHFIPAPLEGDWLYGSPEQRITITLPAGISAGDIQAEEARGIFGSYTLEEAPQGGARLVWSLPNGDPAAEPEFLVSMPRAALAAGAVLEAPRPGLLERMGLPPDTLICVLSWAGLLSIFVFPVYLGRVLSRRRKRRYLPPKIKISGQGIKRGLTAIEAAVLMEHPVDRVLTMVLFSVVKKGAARVLSVNPLNIEVLDAEAPGLRAYEKKFLKAMQEEKPAARKKALQSMMVSLVRSVNTKMRGFSYRQTKAYYEKIIEKAWAQVQAADTPGVQMETLDKALPWTLLDDDFDDRARRVFRSRPVYLPSWWGAYDPSFGRGRAPAGGGSRSGGAPAAAPSGGGGSSGLPNLPGGEFAASVVTGIQSFSTHVIGDLTDFTSGITSKTNPIPKSRSRGGGRRGGGGGSSCACACACACAGCACACAGGGR